MRSKGYIKKYSKIISRIKEWYY